MWQSDGATIPGGSSDDGSLADSMAAIKHWMLTWRQAEGGRGVVDQTRVYPLVALS